MEDVELTVSEELRYSSHLLQGGRVCEEILSSEVVNTSRVGGELCFIPLDLNRSCQFCCFKRRGKGALASVKTCKSQNPRMV